MKPEEIDRSIPGSDSDKLKILFHTFLLVASRLPAEKQKQIALLKPHVLSWLKGL